MNFNKQKRACSGTKKAKHKNSTNLDSFLFLFALLEKFVILTKIENN
jgi:hypothetical protein